MKSLYGLFIAKADDIYAGREMFDFCYAEDLHSAMMHFINRYRFQGKKVGDIYGNYFILPSINVACIVSVLEEVN